MEVLKGKYFMLYVLKEGLFNPVACLTSNSINFNQEVKEATKPPQSRAKSYYAGMYGYDISADGLCYMADDKVSAMDLVGILKSAESIRWMMMDENSDKYFFTGYVIPTSISITGPAEGLATFSMTAVGDGDISTNNPYHTSFIQLDDIFGTEDKSFLTQRTIDGDFPDYK